MNIAQVRDALFWCFILNLGFVTLWWLASLALNGWLHRLINKWFHVSVERFDAINLTALALYKAGNILFFLVPYIALRIVG